MRAVVLTSLLAVMGYVNMNSVDMRPVALTSLMAVLGDVVVCGASSFGQSVIHHSLAVTRDANLNHSVPDFRMEISLNCTRKCLNLRSLIRR